MFYDTEYEVYQETEIPHIYALCGKYANGKILSVISYYTDDDNAGPKTFTVDFGKNSEYEIYLLDAEHDSELVKSTNDLTLTMEVNTCIMIKEK